MSYFKTLGKGENQVKIELVCTLCNSPTRSHERDGRAYCHKCWVKYNGRPPIPIPKKKYTGRKKNRRKLLPKEGKRVKIGKKVVK